MSKTIFTKDFEGPTLTMERTFDASLDAIWQAFTDASTLEKWWGPRGWKTEVRAIDIRPGGTWHYCMTEEATGQESWGLGKYANVTPKTHFSYVDAFSNPEGTVNEAMPAMDIAMHFAEADGKTTVTSVTKFASREQMEEIIGYGVEEGAGQQWDRLAELIEA